ncbi:MAG TPA: hypothetical protein VNU92_08765 [Edaphobacter sp.]|nr:hypothetical protein [Edaphobacter sp.]
MSLSNSQRVLDGVDDEGVNRKLRGCEVEAKGFDVPMGEGVGVVRCDKAFGHFRVEVIDPVDDKVMTAREARMVLDWVASGGLGKVDRKVCHRRSVEAHAWPLSSAPRDQDAAAGESDTFGRARQVGSR